MSLLQIFKPGRHTARNGNVIDFTEAMLTAAAAAYDPAKHEAPLVVGHPASDAPAYGWTKSLAFSDGVLAAEPHQVDAQFAEMVNKGHFKKLSASFFLPDAPENPVQGVYYLRHIGFLGAQPPAVKGLKSASFAGAGAGVVEFADWSMQSNATLWRRFRDFVIEKFGLETADKVVPDFYIADIEREALKDSPSSSSYSEPDMETKEQREVREAAERKLKADQEQLTRDRAAHDARTAEFAERERAVSAAELAQRRVEIGAFVDGLVTEGRVLPAFREGMVAYMAGPNATGVIEFSEGEGDARKAITAKPADWLRDYLKKQPKVVDFAEHGKRGVQSVDATDANAIAKAALEYQDSEKKAGRTISITQAVTHITKAGK